MYVQSLIIVFIFLSFSLYLFYSGQCDKKSNPQVIFLPSFTQSLQTTNENKQSNNYQLYSDELKEIKNLFEKEYKSLNALGKLLESEKEFNDGISPITAKLPRNVNSANLFRSSPDVEVLLWNGYTWTDMGALDTWKAPNYLGHDIPLKDCGLKCNIGPSRGRTAFADAIVFEAQPLAGFLDEYVNKKPEFPQKRPGQFFVNMGYEQPHYFHLYGHPDYMALIDMNMTYSQKSQVPISLTCMWGGGNLEDFLIPQEENEERPNLIAWFGTNCHGGGAHKRTEFMEQLMEHINVHSFGQCKHTKDLPEHMRAPIYNDHGLSMRNKVEIFSKYKFVLALENNNVTDYVTEKIINAFQARAVPIYMGAPNIDEWTPGDHSIIKVDSFETPKQLADYIKILDKNDRLYKEYFAWKKVGLSSRFLQKFSNCVFYSGNCRLCQKIEEYRRLYKLIHGDNGHFGNSQRSSTNNNRNINEIDFDERGVNPETDFMRYNSYALRFEGRAYFLVDNIKNFSLNLSNKWTIGVWVQVSPRSPEEMIIIQRGSESEVGHFSLSLKKRHRQPTNNQEDYETDLYRLGVYFCYRDEIDLKCHQSNTFFPEKRFNYISVSYKSKEKTNTNEGAFGEMEFIINTIIHDTIPIPTPLPITSTIMPFYIGGNGNNNNRNNFVGLMDDLSLWNEYKSIEEINKIRYTIQRGDEKNLLSYWSCNEGRGITLYDHTIHQLNGQYVGQQFDWVESLTKPLILRRINPIAE